jgi:divalent metal cation (Fe/Co/Zn/Cd) transporter
MDAVGQITDTVDTALLQKVEAEVQRFVSEQRGVHSFSHLRARKTGADALVDLHIVRTCVPALLVILRCVVFLREREKRF